MSLKPKVLGAAKNSSDEGGPAGGCISVTDVWSCDFYCFTDTCDIYQCWGMGG